MNIDISHSGLPENESNGRKFSEAKELFERTIQEGMIKYLQQKVYLQWNIDFSAPGIQKYELEDNQTNFK